jgi:archaemetzincin
MSARILQLVAFGSPPLSLLRELEEPLRNQLSIQIAPGRQQLPTPTYAFNKDRHQYHSNAIMRRLASMVAAQHWVMAVLDEDLFVPDSPFVFGEADRQMRIALVSLFRLREGADPDLLRRRLQVEAVHQAGHLVGLSYCEDPRCVMFLASAVSEVDRKGQGLCNLCRNELQKLGR